MVATNPTAHPREKYRNELTARGWWGRLPHGQRQALARLIDAADEWLTVPGRRGELERVTGYAGGVLKRTVDALAAHGLIVRRTHKNRPPTYKLTIPTP